MIFIHVAKVKYVFEILWVDINILSSKTQNEAIESK